MPGTAYPKLPLLEPERATLESPANFAPLFSNRVFAVAGTGNAPRLLWLPRLCREDTFTATSAPPLTR